MLVLRYLQKTPWDLVINTHFLPAEIIADLRTRKQLAVPQATVTTDFETRSARMSVTASGLSSVPAATALAASSVKPPPKIARRRKTVRSS